ncbi:MAG: tail fiber domain-containing protein [Bacteroidota bacterium]
MKNKWLLFVLFISSNTMAQNVGINNTDPKTALDVNGALRLRPVTTMVSGTSVVLNSQAGYHFVSGTPTGNFSISFSTSVSEGHHTIITNTTVFTGNVFSIQIPLQTTVELFFSNGEWKQIGSSQPVTGSAWGLTGNAGINALTQFIGTTSNADVVFKRDNIQSGLLETTYGSTSWGVGALHKNNYGTNNTAIGISAMAQNQDGSENVATGAFALANNSGGFSNTAVGKSALATSTEGDDNTAIGTEALFSNTLGDANTATGKFSLYSNLSGNANTAYGFAAMVSNTSGFLNTAIGTRALNNNTTGFSNVAVGVHALFSNTTPGNLVAIGDSALFNNGIGVGNSGLAVGNTAIGSKALYKNTLGSNNTALGMWALFNNITGDYNTAIGQLSAASNTTGVYNTSVGGTSLQSNRLSNYNVAIGNEALNGYNSALEESGNNVAVGTYALHQHYTGVDNVAVGRSALSFNYAGNRNTAIGSRAGERSYNTTGNVFIGYEAGSGSDFTNNKLYIENSNKDSLDALIYGDFAADSLLLNAKTINKFSLNVRGANVLEMGYGVGGKQSDAGKISYGGFGDANFLGIVGAGSEVNGNDRIIKLWSEGGLRIKGNALPDANNFYSLGSSTTRWKEVWTNAGAINTSDANLKTNISNSPYGLDEVMRMQPVQYNWKSSPNEDLQIGFLAQDIQKIIPEAVVVPANGDPLGMKYTELIPVLVKAMQEQQQKIEQLEKLVKELKK